MSKELNNVLDNLHRRLITKSREAAQQGHDADQMVMTYALLSASRVWWEAACLVDSERTNQARQIIEEQTKPVDPEPFEPHPIDPKDAIPGCWYESPRWGRMLCVGTSDPEKYIPGFVIRNDIGATRLVFLKREFHGTITFSSEQGWED